MCLVGGLYGKRWTTAVSWVSASWVFFLPGDRISIILQEAALFSASLHLILVSAAETGLGEKSPRKQSAVWEALMFLELWLKTVRFGLHYLECAVE